jgi:UDP-glucose 4-epimerase
MKIMVTGGAGFIGSNVVDGYTEAGHEVVVLDNLSSGKEQNIHPDAAFYKVDIRNHEIDGIMRKEKPDILNHHAAQISVPVSVSDPLLDADINIKGFLNLLESAVRHHVKKCIFISSGGAIYGEAQEYPTSEGYSPHPLSPYAVSKFTSEHYLTYYRHQYGLNYTTLRYANVYGPRQIPHGEAGVVAIFMNNLLQDKSSLLYHFPEDEDGMVRDYCYVGDVVSANIEALNKGEGLYFNIGSGKGTKTIELYRVIYEAVKDMRPDLRQALAVPKREKARPGDIRRSCLVVDRALRGLGWSPQKDLVEGIRLTFAWWQEQRA